MPIEREYKSLVPDECTFSRLLTLEMHDAWRFAALPLLELEDQYLDTDDRMLYRAGWACRIRRMHDGAVLSVKSFGSVRDGLHAREEIESPLAGELTHGLPDTPAGSFLRTLIAESPLHPLCSLRQQRHRRILSGGEGTVVGELSCDRVRLTLPGGVEHALLVAELECASECRMDTLADVHHALATEYALSPMNESKFHWAMRLLAPVTPGEEDDGRTLSERANV